MFSKRALTPEENRLAETLNIVESQGISAMTDSVMPKMSFSYNEDSNSTRLFSEIRLDQLAPEVKSFMLSALESSKAFLIEKTADGSPYDCAIFEKNVRGRVGVTHESQSQQYDKLRDQIENSIQSYSTSVRKDLFGKGFPVKLPNPFSETKPDGEGVFAKFRQRVKDKEMDQTPSLA